MIERDYLLTLTKDQLVALLESRGAAIVNHASARDLLARAVEDATLDADTMVKFFEMNKRIFVQLAADQERILSGQPTSAALN